jgi:SAM-dependent methyltransferase
VKASWSQDAGWAPADLYDEAYYASGLGEPYVWTNSTWREFFDRIADFIVAEIDPTTVLDVGCGIGFLLKSLRDRGVAARGIDISEYALSQVPDALKSFCARGSITDELEGTYDLITCLEVLEHVPPELSDRAIENLTKASDRVLFSSTPTDDQAPTHINVRQPDSWVRAFARCGFFAIPGRAPDVIAPQAIYFARGESNAVELAAAYEIVRFRTASSLAESVSRLQAVTQELTSVELARARADDRVAAFERELIELDTQLSALGDDLESTVSDADRLEVELEELRTTTWWRVGAPVRAAVTWVRLAGARHEPGRSARLGRGSPPEHLMPLLVAPLKALVPIRVRRAARSRFPALVETVASAGAKQPPHTVDELVAERLPVLRPLSVFPAPGRGRPFVTLVTDSLSPGSLFGGVGTALILGATLARKLDASLRIVTESEPPDPSGFAAMLAAQGVGYNGDVDFVYSPRTSNRTAIPTRVDDLFVTTSWWATWSALRTVAPDRIVYLLQEDERLFYPAGDEQLLCSEVLADRRIRFIVNTAMLYEHLVAEGFQSIEKNGLVFEPAFPERSYFRETVSGQRRTFFFYARPGNVRNLFIRGLEAINESVNSGVLEPADWTFHFVGRDIPDIELPYGITPERSENLPWADYVALVRKVDVGLALMSSPHPSYPPLDLAACGAVAVTNRFGSKRDLGRYSANIISADPSVAALKHAIADAVELAGNERERVRNYESSNLTRDWNASLGPVVELLTETN